MKDYIFLIIAVVISIIAAINKNKKKDGNNPFVKKDERPRNFFMDQLLGEDFLAEPVEVPKPQAKIRPVLKKEPLVTATTASQSGQYNSKFRSTLPDRQIKNLQPTLRKPRIEVVETELETDEIPSYLEDFSLRKAFVYSEIMTPKYQLDN